MEKPVTSIKKEDGWRLSRTRVSSLFIGCRPPGKSEESTFIRTLAFPWSLLYLHIRYFSESFTLSYLEHLWILGGQLTGISALLRPCESPHSATLSCRDKTQAWWQMPLQAEPVLWASHISLPRYARFKIRRQAWKNSWVMNSAFLVLHTYVKYLATVCTSSYKRTDTSGLPQSHLHSRALDHM